MVGYLNDKDGYQVCVPSISKIVRSHDVYFKPEEVCTATVVETGTEITAEEDVAVNEKRQEHNIKSESSQPENNLEMEAEDGLSRNAG
jgi:hypothetical protein